MASGRRSGRALQVLMRAAGGGPGRSAGRRRGLASAQPQQSARWPASPGGRRCGDPAVQALVCRLAFPDRRRNRSVRHLRALRCGASVVAPPAWPTMRSRPPVNGRRGAPALRRGGPACAVRRRGRGNLPGAARFDCGGRELARARGRLFRCWPARLASAPSPTPERAWPCPPFAAWTHAVGPRSHRQAPLRAASDVVAPGPRPVASRVAHCRPGQGAPVGRRLSVSSRACPCAVVSEFASASASAS